MKDSGSILVSGTPPIPKKGQEKVYKCAQCNSEYREEANYKKHIDFYHKPRIEKDDDEEQKNSDKDVMEVSTAQSVTDDQNKSPPPPPPAQQRSFNCRVCDFQSNSGRLLFRHVQSTLHLNTDDLSMQCHSCNTTSKNYMELMKHRKTLHYSELKVCKFILSGETCHFRDRCFYRHTATPPPAPGANNIVVKETQGFHLPQQSVPPDQMSQLCNQMMAMNTTITQQLGTMTKVLESMQSQQSQQTRGPGVSGW